MLNKSLSFYCLRRAVRIFITALLLISIFSLTTVSALDSIDVADNGYTYWEGTSSKTAVKIKSMYEPIKTISGLNINGKEFGCLDYIYTFDNKLYILDSVNGIISVLNSEYKLIENIDSFNYQGDELSVKGAKGMYVDESGIYIADTQNKRILCSDGKNVFKIITRPDSLAVPDTLVFAPTRLVRDKSGYIYALCEGSYFGLMVFSETYDFLGFYGANRVTATFGEAIKNLITSFFETEEKHNASVQALPFQMVDVCIDSEGFICTINGSSKGQIKRFGPAGTNNLTYSEHFDVNNSDAFNFGDNPYAYLDTSSRYGTSIIQSLDSITSCKDGFYYISDSIKGRIFVYDKNCQLLNAFGGGVGEGRQLGMFVTPTAIAVLGDDLLVSDFSTKKITVFSLTEYGKLLKEASVLANKFEYIKAKPYWTQILASDKNNQLAYRGLALAALEEKDYKNAMTFAKSGLDRVTYSKAFECQKDNFLKENFWWLGLIVISTITGLLWLILISKKRKIVLFKNERLRIAFNTMVHPIDTFKSIKEQKGSVIIATIFLFVFYIVTVSSKLYGGFMYGSVSVNSFNAIFTLIGSVGLVFLWVITNWLICVLFEGKGHLKEIYCSTCYSLMPLIIYNILYLILSHVSIPSDNSGFGILSLIFKIFMIVLILLSVTVIHDFDFFKSIGTSILSIIGMCIVGFVIFLILTLFQDLLAFVLGIFNEVSLR